MKQIEQKKNRHKGMTDYEFDLNKNLLKEIAEKKKVLAQSIQMQKTQQ